MVSNSCQPHSRLSTGTSTSEGPVTTGAWLPTTGGTLAPPILNVTSRPLLGAPDSS